MALEVDILAWSGPCGSSRVLARLRSASLFGIEASLVEVEVDVSFGLPTFNMVGLPDSSVRESRDRYGAPFGTPVSSFLPIESRSISRPPTFVSVARRMTSRSRLGYSPRAGSSHSASMPTCYSSASCRSMERSSQSAASCRWLWSPADTRSAFWRHPPPLRKQRWCTDSTLMLSDRWPR